MSNLTQGIHFFSSHKYDDALEFFCSLHLKERTSTEAAEIQIWMGRCYFEKREVHEYFNEHPSYLGRRCGQDPSRRNITTKRMSEVALTYFNAALQDNPNSSTAHYWRGKVLEYEKKIDEAYQDFIFAASLDCENREYRKKCCEIFEAYPHLVFLEMRSPRLIHLEHLNQLSTSSYSYERIEACQSILNTRELPENTIQKIQQLAGHKFLCWYFPGSGDPDRRVRDKARSVLTIYH